MDIALSEPVALTFSLKYLVNFCKAAGLSDRVKLCLSNEVPLLVEYQLSNNSYLRFYLAPKVRKILTSQFPGIQQLTFSRSAMRSRFGMVFKTTKCIDGVHGGHVPRGLERGVALAR